MAGVKTCMNGTTQLAGVIILAPALSGFILLMYERKDDSMTISSLISFDQKKGSNKVRLKSNFSMRAR